MHEHVSFELGVVQEPLVTTVKGALEQFVAVDSHVLFEGGAVIEDFGAGLQVAFKNARMGWCAESRAGPPARVASDSLA